MYRAAKRDKNETHIIRFLRRCGASVVQLDDPGVSDLLVGVGGLNLLLEVKGKTGRLTPQQKKFFDDWCGQVSMIRSITDAKEILRSIMPVYHYRCSECNHEFERKQRITEPALKECPNCAGKLFRVPQPPLVTLYHGSGWAGKDDKHQKS